MQIEITYMILFAVALITLILTWTRKMSVGIGLCGIGLAFAIGFIIAPYSSLIMNPVSWAIAYGGSWTLSAILGVSHILSMCFIAGIGVYNLMMSKGKIIWA